MGEEARRMKPTVKHYRIPNDIREFVLINGVPFVLRYGQEQVDDDYLFHWSLKPLFEEVEGCIPYVPIDRWEEA